MTLNEKDELIDEVIPDIIDVEEYAKADKKPPLAKKYRIRIDAKKYEVSVPAMTGRELLALSGNNPPEKYALYEKLKGGKRRRIQLDEKASFVEPGVEKFMTLPLDQTEG